MDQRKNGMQMKEANSPGISIETENGLTVSGARRVGDGEWLLTGTCVFMVGDENVLSLDCGDNGTIMWIY